MNAPLVPSTCISGCRVDLLQRVKRYGDVLHRLAGVGDRDAELGYDADRVRVAAAGQQLARNRVTDEG